MRIFLGISLAFFVGCGFSPDEMNTGRESNTTPTQTEQVADSQDRDSAPEAVEPTSDSEGSAMKDDSPTANTPDTVTREILVGTWRAEMRLPSGTWTLDYTLKDDGQFEVGGTIVTKTGGKKLTGDWEVELHDDGTASIQLKGPNPPLDPIGESISMDGKDAFIATYYSGTTARFQRVVTE